MDVEPLNNNNTTINSDGRLSNLPAAWSTNPKLAAVKLPEWVHQLASMRHSILSLSKADLDKLDAARLFAQEVTPSLINKKRQLMRQMQSSSNLAVAANKDLLGSIDVAEKLAFWQDNVAILCRIYIGSIYYELNEQVIVQSFVRCGHVLKCQMSYDPMATRHRGYGFIEYDTVEAAQLAQDRMSGFNMGNRQIRVGRTQQFPNEDGLAGVLPAAPSERIFIANIHEVVTRKDLFDIFSACGNVVRMFMPSLAQGDGANCNIYTYLKEVVLTEIEGLNEVPNGEVKTSVSSFINAKLPDINIDIEDLLDKKHRGWCLLEYDSEESAKAAIEAMNEFELGGLKLQVIKAIYGHPISLIKQ